MPRDATDDILPEELLQAYSLGYFPMAQERNDPHAVWVLPDERGILDLEFATAPRKLKRFIKSHPFEIKINTAFCSVINECAAVASDRQETWINDAIISAYTDLHKLGHAHSIECYLNGKLVGGLYGVSLGQIFCGESMFSRETNASKVAMLYLITHLKHCEFKIIDTQFYSEHLGQFGVTEISNAEYQEILAAYAAQSVPFSSEHDYWSTATVLQSINQIS